eukprot:365429-Chlamydomonas_euryale.AAC.2
MRGDRAAAQCLPTCSTTGASGDAGAGSCTCWSPCFATTRRPDGLHAPRTDAADTMTVDLATRRPAHGHAWTHATTGPLPTAAAGDGALPAARMRPPELRTAGGHTAAAPCTRRDAAGVACRQGCAARGGSSPCVSRAGGCSHACAWRPRAPRRSHTPVRRALSRGASNSAQVSTAEVEAAVVERRGGEPSAAGALGDGAACG